MRCLITGVAGFIGSSIAEKLLAQGHVVVGIDSFLPYYPREIKERNIAPLCESKSFHFLEKDLLSEGLFSELGEFEWIFHQAAQAGVRASWGEYFDTYTLNNILATQRLLESLRVSGYPSKFIYASSSSVYGDAESFPTSEQVAPVPVSPYGVTKLAAEHLCRLYASQFNVHTVSLRYFTVFGPKQRPDMAFHRFCKAALLDQEITLYGDGEQSRDFTFISDIVDANLLAAQSGGKGSFYNVGGGEVVTINQVLTHLESLIGKPLKVNRVDKQAGDARHTSANTDKARDELGYAPKVSVFDGLSQELQWVDKNLELLGTGSWQG
ncbi:NAD-dependent epimerase/dehydratase family protein [bacterium]|nr:NAD-dependent epimerase/dehydratase family protein [bacterium]